MPSSNFWKQPSTYLPILGLLAALLTGIFLHRDYSISGDGVWVRSVGGRNAIQVNQKLDYTLLSEMQTRAFIEAQLGETTNVPTDSLATTFAVLPGDRFHGVWFEFVLLGVEIGLDIDDKGKVFFMRHLVTHLYFLLAVVAFYFLLLQLFKNWKVALLGCLFLLLSPRIYAHSFFNSKDLAFLSAYWIAVWALFRYFARPGYRRAILLGFLTALAIDIRIMGMLLPCLALGWQGWRLLFSSSNKKEEISTFFVYILVLIPSVILFWPLLWDAPLQRFQEAFATMSSYHWEGSFLFNGELLTLENGQAPPWYFVPLWMLYSTPLLYLLGFLGFLILGLRYSVRSIFDDQSPLFQRLIILSLLVIPLLAVIIFQSVLYGDWRHLYFVYPAFIILATAGFL